MKAIVFGATGFIGGHVVEQLHLAGHEITACVRTSSNTTFLESLGVKVVQIDFSSTLAIQNAIKGNEVVYNCTASANLQTTNLLESEVEAKLTRTLIEAASSEGASRFIQLSTIVIYDFNSNESIDESYISQPEYPIQHLGLERERIVLEVGRKTGIDTVILRPASTIGVRDVKSFFSRLLSAHTIDKYPLFGRGSTNVSLVDTRDIGRAMVWLGTYQKPEDDNGVYLLKGFDTTWKQLKIEIDRVTGKIAKTMDLPKTLTNTQMLEYKLTPFAVNTFTVNRTWNDQKIRNLGFNTKYSLSNAVEIAVEDIKNRNL